MLVHDWPLVHRDDGFRHRLKLFGRVEVIDQADPRLEPSPVAGYRGCIECGVVIHVAAFDWNCPQHIAERLAPAEVEKATGKLIARIGELEARIQELGG